MTVMLMMGDCRRSMAQLRDGSVQTCVTSPPYFGLRDYGHDGQIGLEPTPDEFVSAMVEVFREVKRVLRDDGTLWLNLGDSYFQGHGGSSTMGKGATMRKRVSQAHVMRERNDVDVASWSNRDASRREVIPGCKPKDLMGIPWRVAFALQADGWWLRQDIIWHKPNPMPESVTDRCTKAHEYIFLLSKSPRYYFDSEAIREPATYAPSKHEKTRGRTDYSAASGVNSAPQRDPKGGLHSTEFRNRRDVWTVSTKPFKGAHFATFPPDLIEPCVLAGAPAGGVVLDPFGGAGTTGLVAQRNGRHSILCELNYDYAAIMCERLGDVFGWMGEVVR